MRLLLILIVAVSIYGASITITDNSGFSTSESGTSITFDVVFDSAPDDDMTLIPYITDSTEGKITSWTGFDSPFLSSGGWNVARVITIEGLPDDIVDGDINFDLEFYEGNGTIDLDNDNTGLTLVSGGSVTITNTDDDDKIVVEKYAGYRIDENGSLIVYSAILKQAPTDDVTISLDSNDTGEATVFPSSLTFTSGNWNTAQTFTVTGVDDSISDGDTDVKITIGDAVSSDGNFNNFVVADLTLTNYDDEAGSSSPEVLIYDSTQSASTYSAKVKLATQPTDDVIVIIGPDMFLTAYGITVSDPASKIFIFTTANWDTYQDLVITRDGTNKLYVGTSAFSAITATTTSTDGDYSGTTTSLSELYYEDSSESIIVNVTDSTFSDDSEDNASFEISLSSAPVAASVTLAFNFLENTEGGSYSATLTDTSITFDSTNWSTPYEVNVSMSSDGEARSDITKYIKFSSISNSDSTPYDATKQGYIELNATNSDTPSFVVTNSSEVNTSESGDTGSFSVALAYQPFSDINVTIESQNTSEGVVTTPASKELIFTTNDWNTPQSVTITGVDDSSYDGFVDYNITLKAHDDTDNVYNGVEKNVTITNKNDEAVTLTLNIADLNITDHNISEVWAIGQNGNNEQLIVGSSHTYIDGTNSVSSSLYNIGGEYSLKFVTDDSGSETYWWYNFSDSKVYEDNDYSDDFKTTLTSSSITLSFSGSYGNWIETPVPLDIDITFASAPSGLIDMNITAIDANQTGEVISGVDVNITTDGTATIYIPVLTSSFYLAYDTNASDEFVKKGYYSSSGVTKYTLKDATPIDSATMGSSVTFTISVGNLITGDLNDYENITKFATYPIRVDGNDYLEFGIDGTDSNYSYRLPDGEYKFKVLVKDDNGTHRDFYASSGTVKRVEDADTVSISGDKSIDINRTAVMETKQISYSSGWNLISIPAKTKFDLGDLYVFFKESNNVSHLVKYSPINGWSYFWLDEDSKDPEYSRFTEVGSTEGMWLKADGSGTIDVPQTGYENNSSSELLSSVTSGWNLIGFPVEKTAESIVSIVESNGFVVDALWIYSAGSWYAYYPNTTDVTSTLGATDPIYCYEGVWVKVQ